MKRFFRSLRGPVPFCHLRLFFSRNEKSRTPILLGVDSMQRLSLHADECLGIPLLPESRRFYPERTLGWCGRVIQTDACDQGWLLAVLGRVGDGFRRAISVVRDKGIREEATPNGDHEEIDFAGKRI